MSNLWYAVMENRDDDDWGKGSYDVEEAKKMCADIGPDAYIAVIEEVQNPVCVEEIYQENF